jgi:hypothetical protein
MRLAFPSAGADILLASFDIFYSGSLAIGALHPLRVSRWFNRHQL